MKEFWSKLMDCFLVDCFLKAKLPLWAYGLECEICRMTLMDERAHYKHAKNNRTIRQHQGKIPIIKK